MTISQSHVLDTLHAWAGKDRHLANFSAGLSGRLARRRQDAYVAIAGLLTDTVGILKVDDYNVSRLAKKRHKELTLEEQQVEAAAAANRQAAAPASLRRALQIAAARRGVHTEVVAARHTADVHNPCGTRVTAQATDGRILHCPTCNMRYDQDFNAVDNLLD